MSPDTAVRTTLRPISRQEYPEYFRVIVETFGGEVRASDREADLLVFEPERSLAVFDGDQIAGTTGIYSRNLTVPGASIPVAAVTMVSVPPTYRRRGHLTAMMRAQLTELFESSREPVAALWASEAPIYGRFGYGAAARHGRLTARTRRLRLRSDVDLGGGRVRQVSVEAARPHLAAAHEQARTRTVGWLDRRDRWWDFRLQDPEHERNGATPYHAVVHEEGSGEVTGYALYRIKPNWRRPEPDGEVRIRELAALTPQAYAALWSFLLQLDLVRNVEAVLPVDAPLRHMVTDIRAANLSVYDNLWVRVVDVGRGLAARSYLTDVDVVLDVSDEFCPWNAGRWRLSGGPDGAVCSRTPDPADLALSSTELGAAYLGGTPLSTLAAAGRVRELRGGALSEASRAFGHDHEPWCPEVF